MTTLAPVPRIVTVSCILCGRSPGQLVDDRFQPDPHTRPPRPSAGGAHCGECGGSLYAEQVTTVSQPRPAPPAAVLVSVDEIVETPVACNSRLTYDVPGLRELAASIRQHGVLQPLVVRPLTAPERDRGGDRIRYVVIAGNRRLRAARAAGLNAVPCMVRVADADHAFLLNVVENLQRRELSGRERVRAISLLARLVDAQGQALGVREISRRTGLSPATISLWLRLDRRPLLRRAVEEERLDIGRAMKLVSAPESELSQLIEQAHELSSDELAHMVASKRKEPDAQASRRAAVNQRHAEAAYRAVELIDEAGGPTRATLVKLRERLDALLAEVTPVFTE
ncbi:MAG: ParB/RepB/Spo0J family partition protein [Chloroflexi bacterium]|nr:ParB/RepB/Spo0J family partition protein [Chloroflexota bacterium]MBV9892695.1 ParB/RepB/Spo0J family partition protein [Chloroflexota bacterium]